MPAVPVGSLGKKGLISLVAVVAALLLGGPAAAAEAATISVTPLITGQGSVSGAGTTCTHSTANESATLNCGQRTFPGGSFVFLDVTAQPGSSPAGHWSFAGWSGCSGGNAAPLDADTCRIFAFGSQVVTISLRATFNDSVGPTVTSATAAFSTSTDRGVSFVLGANETLSIGFCSVDGTPGQPCHEVRQFAEGTHTVRVQGVDLNGNTGPLSGTLSTFQVIDTKLLSGPPDFSSEKRPTFRFSTVAGIDFQCSLDGAAFADCGGPGGQEQTFTPAADLSEGSHTLRIRAVDGPDFDQVPVTRTWTVDTIAPNTTLFSPTLPEGVVTTLLQAEFTFGSTEPLGRLDCKLDTAVFAACTSPITFTDLAFGAHRFEVRAVDRAGNVDATPAARNWEIAARDEDGDGFNQRSDCNENDASINPSRPEILDNDIDENCDGVKGINLDRDADGVNRPADCDDANRDINPNRPEILDDDVDENCDGVKGINLDRDGDGATRPADCDDANPNVRPGAADLPNNSIDEDCRDGDLREVIQFDLARSFARFPAHTVLTRFQVKKAPTGSTVRASCKFKKKKCPKKARKAFTKRNVAGTVALKQFMKLKLKPGTTITVTVTKPGAIGAVKILTIRRGKDPSVVDRCLPPGARRPVAC